MDETVRTVTGTPPAGTEQSSATGDGTTSQSLTPKTYTDADIQKAVSDALTKAGREHKIELTSVSKERDVFKAQIEAKTTELEDIVTEREKLQEQLDQLSSDDPEKFNIIKRDKELRDEQRKLKGERSALEAEKQANADKVQMATETLREIAIWEIAAEYQGGDPVKLKDLCDVFNATSEEQIRRTADIIWAKPLAPTATVAQPLHVDSGVTSGGGIDYTKLKGDDLVTEALRQERKKRGGL